MNVAFFGTPRFAQIVLEKLIDSPFKPKLVVTAPDTKSGRGQKVQYSPVKQTALKHHINILEPTNLSDPNFEFRIARLERVSSRKANFEFDLAILVAYGKIIPQEILKIPKYGFINVHPSLLPKYRGPSPIQSAILKGEQKTGVTIIKLDEQIDHGPILAQKEIKIEDSDTHASLIEKLGNLGADLLVEVLQGATLNQGGTSTGKDQDHSQATFTKRITKEDGKISLKNPPDPRTFDRMVRAYYPWPNVWSEIESKYQSIKVSKLRIKFLPSNIDTLTHRHIDTFLIQPEGKRTMSISEFKNGYPEVYKKISQLFK